MAYIIIASGIMSLLIASIVVLIACKIQAQSIHKAVLEHEAWQQAQEAHHNLWEAKQRKRALDLEQSLNKQIQEIHEEWQRWESNATQRLTHVTLEQKITLLPYIDDIPVPSNEYTKSEQIVLPSQLSHPISFFRTDLRGQDLSRRFLQQADFRETQLENANFYMADLAGASFKGANLSGANLAGANLNGADLRDAILAGANLLVTDLNGTILNGANLFGARNLTSEQFNSAIHNSETQIDLEHDLAHARIAGISFTELKPSPEVKPVEFDPPPQASRNNRKRK
jgi:uncharacterized protein YjbI with pentapeptide repeats